MVWPRRPLGTLLKRRLDYGANSPAVPFSDGLPRYIRITDIGEDGRLFGNDPRSIAHEAAEGCMLAPGDVLFARSGATVGKTYRHQAGPPAAFAGYLIRAQTNEELISSAYLIQFTRSAEYVIWVKKMLRAGAQPNINAEEYASLNIPLPPRIEQDKIVFMLETWDIGISNAEALSINLRRLRQAAMVKIFTASEKHSQKTHRDRSALTEKLGDHVMIVSGQHVLANQVNTEGVGLPYLTGPADFTHGIASISKWVEQAPAICEPGDTLVTVKGSGAGAIFVADQRYAISRQLMAVRLSEGCPGYLPYAMEWGFGQSGDLRHGTIPQLTLVEIKNLQVPIPSRSQQEKIVAALQSSDDAIRAADTLQHMLRLQKSEILSGLISGDLNIPAESKYIFDRME